MTDESTNKAEWEQIFKDFDAKIRKEIAGVVGADATDNWETVGRKIEEKIKSALRGWLKED